MRPCPECNGRLSMDEIDIIACEDCGNRYRIETHVELIPVDDE